MATTLRCKPCYDFNFHQKHANGIYVTDLPPRVMEEDIHRLFSHFGQITDAFLSDSGSYCLIHYYHRQSVDNAMRMPVFLHGRKLRIKLRNVSGPDKERLKKQIPSYHEELLKSISQCENRKTQAEEFVKAVQADESHIRKQIEARRDLEKALSQFSASSACKIFQFGSSVTGLAFKDSDLDIFYGKEPSNKIGNILNHVKKILYKHKCFVSIEAIPHARVPIIKMVHEPTGCNFDLSFKSSMGVANSNMIKFFMSVDERLKPLFMIVKYWAKLHHLTGKRMSNYALLLLLINFLQSLNEPILPPFCSLQHDGLEAKIIDGWNANFDDDITRLKPVSNCHPVEELLCRFFESVVKSDFENYVVCPLMGLLIHRQSFYTSSLPQELKNYTYNVRKGKPHLKICSPLCIQDPIELNFNVTKNLTKDDFQCLKDHCFIAAKLCHAVPPNLFLPLLLSTVFEYPSDDVKKTWMPNPMHLRPLRPCMLLHVPHPENCADEIKWNNDLIQKVVHIFKKVLKIHVKFDNVGEETKPGDSQKLICEGSQVLWKEREKLWTKWFPKKCEASYRDCESYEEVQVLHEIKTSDTSHSQGSSSRKRKRDVEEEGPVGRSSTSRETEDHCNKQRKTDHSVDVIDIEVDVTDKDSSVPRSLQKEINVDERVQDIKGSRSLLDEINLTNVMVRKGHALPASTSILKFSCIICKSSNNQTSIEIADLKSLNNFFSSLCIFLQDFLNIHIINAASSQS